MNVSAANSSASNTTDQASAEGRKAELARLAHQFEAMFLSEMLRGMRESMLSEKQDEGLGNDTMTDTFDGELGLSLSNAGGLGLANLMLDALVRRGDDGRHTSPDTAVVSSESAGAPDSRGVRLQPDVTSEAAVTSPFGWRSDPFTGKQQFHAGTDLRMAYGQSVQAVAGGRVASVGERSGYGLTVVIDHGNGLETRYAHLSGADVQEGDKVEAGQVVARSGNSGRSTGPHLHLEARQNGQPIDIAAVGSASSAPSVVKGISTAGLKVQGLVADSYADRSHVRSGQ